MLLAGDVGGTKTLLGLFDKSRVRPTAAAMRAFTTLDFPDLIAMIEAFTADVRFSGAIHAACFGIAGPVLGGLGQLTNVPWQVDAGQVAQTFAIPRVAMLN